MANVKVCDGCGKPIKRVAAKLFYTVVLEDGSTKRHHSNYDKHADIGECCVGRVNQIVHWQSRKRKPSKIAKAA